MKTVDNRHFLRGCNNILDIYDIYEIYELTELDIIVIISTVAATVVGQPGTNIGWERGEGTNSFLEFEYVDLTW